MRYAVLASGSKANCAVIDHADRLLLIDCGLGPVLLKNRLASLGLEGRKVDTVIMTHMHGDHISAPAIKRLACPVWCHAGHRDAMPECDAREYQTEVPFQPLDGMTVTPIRLMHDSPETHGFRVDIGNSSIGHVADTGAWTKRMTRLLAGVDIMAIEANHDVDMQIRSERPAILIERNLSHHGHLSNDQCKAFLEHLTGRDRKPKHTILLHMSHSCNDAELARSMVNQVVEQSTVAMQDQPTQWFEIS